jgi:hypothetical protein
MPQIIEMKKSEYDKMKAAELREKYLMKTPKGYSKKEIRSMPDDDILDMDYFLNEFEPKPRPDKEPDVIYQLIDDTPPNEFSW